MRKRHIAVSAALTFSLTALTQTSAFAAGSVPGTPTNLASTPTPLTATGAAQPCGTGTAFASADIIDSGRYSVLSATLRAGSDNAGGYSAKFWVSDLTTGTDLAPIASAGQGVDGTPVSVDLPVTDGHTYSWTVNETDGTAWSPSAGPCVFTTDMTAPAGPTVTSTDFPTAGGGLQSGEAGSFTLSDAGDPTPATGTASGFKGYAYSFDTPLSVGGTVVAPNSGTSLVVSGQSFGWGTHTLYVQAVDNAGNVSGETQYSFYVAQNPELSPKLRVQYDGPKTVMVDGGGSTGLYTITQCAYDFGDGSKVDTATECAVTDTHEYAKTGTYPITLTVTDQYGNQKSVTESYTTPGLSKGTLFHAVLTKSTWINGWAEPTGSTGIARAANTALPDGSSQLVAVTEKGALEHDIRYANGSWQGWRTLSQPGVTLTDASIAGMPNGSSQIIEVTTAGVLKHDIRNANGSWQSTGWGSPAGSTGIARASITALPNGSSQLVAVTTAGTLEYNIRNASGSWQGWRVLSQPGVTITDASIAGMPNGSSQIIEVTSAGVIRHNIRNANGSWQASGWGTAPAGQLPFVQASITAMPDGSARLVAADTYGIVNTTIRYANGSWVNGWGQLSQTVHVAETDDVSVAGMPNGQFQVIEVSSL